MFFISREIGDNFENGYSLIIHFRYDEADLRGDIIKIFLTNTDRMTNTI